MRPLEQAAGYGTPLFGSARTPIGHGVQVSYPVTLSLERVQNQTVVAQILQIYKSGLYNGSTEATVTPIRCSDLIMRRKMQYLTYT